MSARALIAIYTMLMGSILVVALALSSWHHGLVTDSGKGAEKKIAGKESPTLPPPQAGEVPQGGGGAKLEVKPDDGESSGVVIEADSEAVKVKPQDWFIYENFKLGHTHLNGQSLVYFSLIVLFLMSTASERSKILWGVLLAFSVVLHTFGLFFMHKEMFALLLRISGSLLALSITVMCAYIFVDTVKRPQAG
uniref:Uncharacterized protein n=1 Tax=uncultured bacterium A1Q1_fos_300 TaxID=1256571 RepID=L7VXB8_9BACT|nr:hypothetical protein [uncultured bacterium A1Q1_fos_300]